MTINPPAIATIPDAYALGAPEGRLVPSGAGDEIWVAELGEGKPTVLLHGGGPGCTSWTDFWTVAPLLAADRRVILLDMQNYGFSTQADAQGPVWTWHASKIAAALDQLGIVGADFICNSIGGSAAIALAADRPDLVRKMVVTGSEPVARGRGAKTPELGEEGATAWTNYYAGDGPSREKIVAIMTRLEYFDPAAVNETNVELRYLYSLTPGQRYLGSAREAWGQPDDLEAKLATVKARILFFYGKQDVFVQDSYPVLLSDIAPHADVYLQDEAGHHMEEERPHDFVGIVTTFLDAGTTNS
ncbi:alpha/beta hydrolase [Nocardioides sp. BP30]|uniref:alpha/beta fold hydrolase n=1 Tax=Nocardioides sp. BP30 TaxID=3036374 RepID=UPI002468E50B|nr:alpha/beta hydrolase [Nocardioides sp. BP30]WGL50791.1 alpha/beta hydrolase [Nocardioides sp. BP30]